MKPKLLMLRGLPASGKSTFARQYVKDHPGAKRVNRDDLRAMIDPEWSKDKEKFIRIVRDQIILEGLYHKLTMIVDDTNMGKYDEKEMFMRAQQRNADFEIKSFTDVPIEECHKRNGSPERMIFGKNVPPKVIDEMWAKWLAWQPKPVEPKPKSDLPEAIICDIDGTVADSAGKRGPFDEHLVSGDEPRHEVIKAVKALSAGRQLIFLSGRHDSCMPATHKWLADYFPLGGTEPAWQLWMRATGDNRKDYVVKEEFYKGKIEPFFNVVAVFDDRPSVVKLWHDLGLQLFNVGNGKEF